MRLAAAGGKGGKGGGGGWANALLAFACDAPSAEAEALILRRAEGNSMVMIADKFPKARHHYLILPSTAALEQPGLVLRGGRLVDGPKDLAARHVPLLREMCAFARASILERHGPSATLVRGGGQGRGGEGGREGRDGEGSEGGAVRGELTFRAGFHVVPSMKHLHLHVISQDFDSARLKNKKHYNSFTTPFFIDVEAAMDELLAGEGREGRGEGGGEGGEGGGGGGEGDSLGLEYPSSRRRREADSLIKGPLRCHWCGEEQRNIPQLKGHIATCLGGLPSVSSDTKDDDGGGGVAPRAEEPGAEQGRKGGREAHAHGAPGGHVDGAPRVLARALFCLIARAHRGRTTTRF